MLIHTCMENDLNDLVVSAQIDSIATWFLNRVFWYLIYKKFNCQMTLIDACLNNVLNDLVVSMQIDSVAVEFLN